MAWMRTKIKLNSSYTKKEREAIAYEILERIVDRTKSENLDKNGKPFPKYSKEYMKSLDFKIAGKGKKVDLTLSGDMLADMKLLSTKKGEINIGFDNGTESNAKAEGNIKGTYGQSVSTGKNRDFLGVKKDELKAILENYPLEDSKSRIERVNMIREIVQDAEAITARLVIDELADE